MTWDDWDAIDAAQAKADSEVRRTRRLAERGMEVVPDAPAHVPEPLRPSVAAQDAPLIPDDAIPPTASHALQVDPVAGLRLWAAQLRRTFRLDDEP